MHKMSKNMLFSLVIVCFLASTSSAQTCKNHNFQSNQIFTSCTDLPLLKSSLHWTYDPATTTARIAYRHVGISPSRWVAWAINPTSKGMVGSQAIVAYQESNGSMRVYTAPIESYQTGLQPGDLSFPVSDLSAKYNDGEITIFATLKLENFSGVVGGLNQVWQEGPVEGDSPGMHDTSGDNVKSMATVNLLSGQSGTTVGSSLPGSSQLRKKNIHGLMNTVSWGIMIPMGAIIARYLKVFKAADPAWFYLHAICQVSAYVVGVAGWATGLQLGRESAGVQFTAHRTIGIVLFCLATIQVSAMLLRPKKDHKHRVYWNIYHHVVGYSIIILGIINIFKGLNILNPQKKWESSYVGVLIGLGLVAATLEVYTWCVVTKRKKSESVEKGPHETNVYSNNGYGSRPHVRI